MGTLTGPTSHWVENSSMETLTGPTSHWVEDSSMGTLTGPTSHWVERPLWEHSLDQHHTRLRDLCGNTHWTNITLG